MKPKRIAASLAVSIIFVSLAGAASAQPDAGAAAKPADRGPVEVVVWNIRKGLGHVRVLICTPMTFASPRKTCPYHGEAVAQVGSTTVVVPDVPAGSYAAEVYQDEQDLDKIKRGPLGVPLEGVGFSNDAAIGLRGPHFNEAAFDHDPSAPVALRIKLRYFPDL